MAKLLNDRDLEFQLYEVLDTESLLQRPRYAEHDRAIFDATLNTARDIAAEYFAPHNQKGDANEPTFDGEKVTLIPETQPAWNAFAEAGFLASHHDFDDGGSQLPEVVLRASMAYFNAANVSSTAYSFLTIGAANLLKSFGSDELKGKYLPSMLDGRYSGTMALTEPGQGSALGDLRTMAKPADDGSYRLFGNKMYISGGDHELTDNIVHMVLARIEGAPAGVRGISLFLVPKFHVNDDGTRGDRNDVALAGLLHKMGYRNTTSTVLNFGEKDGAVGYLVGEPNKGLGYMFQMMNEARIGVGLGAAAMGYQSYLEALDYARDRPQGRLPGNKNPDAPQVKIVEHADVRRMLLMQKAYAEGSLALCLYASTLVEDAHTAKDESERKAAAELLDLITPMVKTWPSKYGVIASDLGIQVLGGAGYTREYPLEQLYRDNRLNPIHEGTEGIQGIDLLGRKLGPKGGDGYAEFQRRIQATLDEAANLDTCGPLASQLTQALDTLKSVTSDLQKQLAADPDHGLSNATMYLDMFGKVLVGWIWLKQAMAAEKALAAGASGSEEQFYQGKVHAARYFMNWELAPLDGYARLLANGNRDNLDMQNDWF
ncbi:acyl-CoA dehydrogenase [Marinobacter segnicrescens]|uniref:Butyryl-CoA dehydrogenase n=1 Tax=Marinobacter segnicrescens TaxID=430453 RepID=A0A1I0A5P9_9GAMM|nr:acyl-CoA dehydrogenase [Marinobacter segnicrescens]SES88986.1 butyryl-CoA dehydrogenase [Marinobacter segnicrescens]